MHKLSIISGKLDNASSITLRVGCFICNMWNWMKLSMSIGLDSKFLMFLYTFSHCLLLISWFSCKSNWMWPTLKWFSIYNFQGSRDFWVTQDIRVSGSVLDTSTVRTFHIHEPWSQLSLTNYFTRKNVTISEKLYPCFVKRFRISFFSP